MAAICDHRPLLPVAAICAQLTFFCLTNFTARKSAPYSVYFMLLYWQGIHNSFYHIKNSGLHRHFLSKIVFLHHYFEELILDIAAIWIRISPIETCDITVVCSNTRTSMGRAKASVRRHSARNWPMTERYDVPHPALLAHSLLLHEYSWGIDRVFCRPVW